MRGCLRILLALALAVAVPAAGAERLCQVALEEAEGFYQGGRLDEARARIDSCLGDLPSPEERTLALTLLAKIHLAGDDLGQARLAIEDLLGSDAGYEPNRVTETPRYLRLVDQVRRESSTVQVSSVSKSAESLREAPATVVVVTAEQIARRGYQDLDQLLHDLPGFDITRARGVTYSNIYQRGYRSDLTTRTLFLIDGVEENDLWTQAAYLSRQYPLSLIERVEVIYGPASTMYGANAFAGVVNVITREPESLAGEGRRLGWHAEAGGGSLGTGFAESVLAGRAANGNVAWSLAGRVFRSDDLDLSGYPEWDYDVDAFDYAAALRISGTDAEGKLRAQRLVEERGLGPSPYYQIVYEDGVAVEIVPTAAGAARARELDREVYSGLRGFTDQTEDWLVHGKLELPNLVLGLQLWRTDEGAGSWYTDRFLAAGPDGTRWIPQQLTLYGKYGRTLRRGLSLSFASRYRAHELADPTFFGLLRTYSRGALTVADLPAGTRPTWQPVYFQLFNSQLQNELSLVYQPSRRWSVVGGAELRDGSLQGNYVTSARRDPARTGGDSDRFHVVDLGAYVQASFRPWPDLKLTAGGRLDHNRIDGYGGYGTAFNPRLAAVWSPGPWVVKAIYSEAFQDASNFQRYLTIPGTADIPNPRLGTETVENVELALSWQDGERLGAELALYQARYSDVPQLRRVPCDRRLFPTCTSATTNRFESVGALTIRGLQASAAARLAGLDLSASYTWADPFNSTLGVRVGDIASHQLRFGVAGELRRRLGFDLRAAWVGDRRTGRGTDVPNLLTSIDGYTVVHLALSHPGPLPGTSVQLVAGNLLDEAYADPGIRQADGVTFAPRIPQPGRTFTLRLSTSRP